MGIIILCILTIFIAVMIFLYLENEDKQFLIERNITLYNYIHKLQHQINLLNTGALKPSRLPDVIYKPVSEPIKQVAKQRLKTRDINNLSKQGKKTVKTIKSKSRGKKK